MAFLLRFKKIMDNPWLECLVGLILLVAGLLEVVEALRAKIPVVGLRLHHAVLFLGGSIVLRSLPALFLGVEFVDDAAPRLEKGDKPLLRYLDRLARSHAMDLFVGGVLVVIGVTDAIYNVAEIRGQWRLNVSYGVIAFGLAPFLNAFIALFIGLKRLDRERRLLPDPKLWGLLGRAMKNPYITFTAGLIMVGSGLAELVATLSENLVVGHNLELVHSLMLFGTFGILNALPELFKGLRQILTALLTGKGDDQVE